MGSGIIISCQWGRMCMQFGMQWIRELEKFVVCVCPGLPF